MGRAAVLHSVQLGWNPGHGPHAHKRGQRRQPGHPAVHRIHRKAMPPQRGGHGRRAKEHCGDVLVPDCYDHIRCRTHVAHGQLVVH